VYILKILCFLRKILALNGLDGLDGLSGLGGGPKPQAPSPDLILVRNSLGRDPASSLEARKADLNYDGKVDIMDLLLARGRLQGR